jgi:signal transduction histidine kinase
MTLRQRLFLTLAPFICLLAAVGAAGILLLDHVADRIDRILKENYESVVYMVGLNEALERIDSSFQFALSGSKDARKLYDDNWPRYEQALDGERQNITEPGEPELVARLEELTRQYRRQGDAFFAARPAPTRDDYFGAPGRTGLLQLFQQIKQVSGDIRVLNQNSMTAASADARRTAARSELALTIALVVTTAVAAALAVGTVRSVLHPLRTMTDSALAIGLGNLEQVVPVLSRDEIGRLAEAFNLMARQLRAYRKTAGARLLRVQRTGQATIDSFPDPVLVVEPGGTVDMANPAARRLLGIPAPSTEEGPGYAWQPPEALCRPLHEALTAQRPFVTRAYDQTISFRLDGEEHAYLPQVLPISDPFGQTLGAAVVLNDVTRFRLLDQMKSDLVATVSHELKTPLTSVRLVLHLLLEETVGPLTPKQTELMVDARDNAERLLNVIEHLLALARLEQGHEPLVVRAVPPQELLQAAADAAQARAEDRHVALTVEPAAELPPVGADPDRMGHALNNLVDNALKWTEPGGRVTLSAAAADGAVRLSVRDTGIGIPPEYLPHVFDKFFRIPDRGHGTGLGLAIVREIVTAHGGQVSCESQPGQGTVFHLTLPVWKEGQG